MFGRFIRKYGEWCAKHTAWGFFIIWTVMTCSVNFGEIMLRMFSKGNYLCGIVPMVIWLFGILVTAVTITEMLASAGRTSYGDGYRSGKELADLQADRRFAVIVQSLGMKSDAMPILERMKSALATACGNFCKEVYEDEKVRIPLDVRVGEEAAQRIRRITKVVWTREVKPDQKVEYTLSDDFRNTTDKFLDALGIYKEERDGLWKFKQDMNGTCSACDVTVMGDFDDPITRPLKNASMVFYVRGKDDKEVVCLSCFIDKHHKEREEQEKQEVEELCAKEKAKETAADDSAKPTEPTATAAAETATDSADGVKGVVA